MKKLVPKFLSVNNIVIAPASTGRESNNKKTVTKIPHPEMADVKNGDELLVVKFGEEEIKDPLLQSLENRITELNDSDEDEDDDGDVVVRVWF